MTDMKPVTPDEARYQLAAADTMAATSGRDVWVGALTTAALGTLVAVVLATTRAFASTNPVALAIGMVAYGLALGALMFWHNRQVRVARRGWNRRHFASFTVTMVLYAIGLAWAAGGSPSWAVFAPYCVLVALPMLLAAGRSARR